jgi:hypothetical protein
VIGCLAILPPTIQSTDYPLRSVWRYYHLPYSTLSRDTTTDINLPTIRSDLYGDTTNDYLLYSTLSQDTTSDYLRRSTLSSDDTSEYLLYSACQYVSRWSRLGTRRRSLPTAVGILVGGLVGVLVGL